MNVYNIQKIVLTYLLKTINLNVLHYNCASLINRYSAELINL